MDWSALDRIIGDLLAAVPNVDAQTVADALLLAASEATPMPAVDDAPIFEPVAEAPELGPMRDVSAPEGEPQPVPDNRPPLYTGTTSTTAEGRPGRAVVVPAGRALALSGELARSLRPLKRPWPHGRRTELDLPATVDAFARCLELIPAFKKAPERWFDLVVVVDGSPSMIVWEETVADFMGVLGRSGSFRALHMRDFDMATLAGTGRRVALVISDCTSDEWLDGRRWQQLRDWARIAPVALVNPLPQKMWRHTGLNHTATRVTPGERPGVANVDLRYRLPPTLAADQPVVPLPVLTLSPHSLSRWARMLMCCDDRGCDAVLVPAVGIASDAEAEPGPDVEPDVEPGQEVEPAHHLVNRFVHLASPDAVRLAVLCSPHPVIDMPVLHLFRQALVPTATVADVAELISGGLFAVETDDRQGVSLQFREGTQPRLVTMLGADDAWQTYDTLSRYIDEYVGEVPGLRAIVADPDGDVAVPAEIEPFAAASRRVMALLDGTPLDQAEQSVPSTSADTDADVGGRPTTLADRFRVGHRFALVIVNDTYQDDRFTPLDSAGVSEFASVLRTSALGGYDLTLLANASASQTKGALLGFLSEREPDDAVLVYFLGHVRWDLRQNLYLAATGTRTDRLDFTAVEWEWLQRHFESCRAEQRALLIDAVDVGVDVQESLHALMSCQRTMATVSRSGSPLASMMVQGILTGNADLDGDGLVSFADARAFMEDSLTSLEGISGFGYQAAIVPMVLARSPLDAVPVPEELPRIDRLPARSGRRPLLSPIWRTPLEGVEENRAGEIEIASGPTVSLTVSMGDGREQGVVGGDRGGVQLVRSTIGQDDPKRDIAGVAQNGRPMGVLLYWNRSLYLWDSTLKAYIARHAMSMDSDLVSVACVESDGLPLVVSADSDGRILVSTLGSEDPGTRLVALGAGRISALTCATVDGNPVVLAADDEGFVRIWDLGTGDPVGEPFDTEASSITALAASPDGNRVLVIDRDSRARIWELDWQAARGRAGLLHGAILTIEVSTVAREVGRSRVSGTLVSADGVETETSLEVSPNLEKIRGAVGVVLSRILTVGVEFGLRIDFLLPRDLLTLDIDRWSFAASDNERSQIGQLFPVAVCSLDPRRRGLGGRVYIRRRLTLDVVRPVPPLAPPDLERILADGPGGVVVGNEVGAGHALELIERLIEMGTPAILWCRPTRSGERFNRELQGLARLPVSELPEAVLRLRQEAARVRADKEHIGRQLVLYWDEPAPAVPTLRFCIAFEVDGRHASERFNDSLQEVLIGASQSARMRRDAYFDDVQGSGVCRLLVVSAIDLADFLAAAIPEMLAILTDLNWPSTGSKAWIRLAVVRGLVQRLPTGYVGDTVPNLYRLLDAAQHEGEQDWLGNKVRVLISDELYREFPRGGFGSSGFEQVTVDGATPGETLNAWKQTWRGSAP